MLAFLCICSHVRRYVPHMLPTGSHIPSGETVMLTSLCRCSHAQCYNRHMFVTRSHTRLADKRGMRGFLLTCSMLPSTNFLDMITHTFGKGGVLTFLCTCLHGRCYVPHIVVTRSLIPSGENRMLASLCIGSHV